MIFSRLFSHKTILSLESMSSDDLWVQNVATLLLPFITRKLCLFAEVEIEENNKKKKKDSYFDFSFHFARWLFGLGLLAVKFTENELENVYGMMMMMVEREREENEEKNMKLSIRFRARDAWEKRGEDTTQKIRFENIFYVFDISKQQRTLRRRNGSWKFSVNFENEARRNLKCCELTICLAFFFSYFTYLLLSFIFFSFLSCLSTIYCMCAISSFNNLSSLSCHCNF